MRDGMDRLNISMLLRWWWWYLSIRYWLFCFDVVIVLPPTIICSLSCLSLVDDDDLFPPHAPWKVTHFILSPVYY